ncbi:MAG TPA: hypothetical protein VJB16_07700 [archaeon]|nr:hypothetical protein [archaeon]
MPATYTGELNIVSTDLTISTVSRRPEPEFQKARKGILSEFAALGLVHPVRFFSFPEQRAYTTRLAAALAGLEGFSFQEIQDADDERMVRRWIPGTRMDEALAAGTEVPVERYLQSLAEAHGHGLFYGDGWPPNLILGAGSHLTRYDIDFIAEDKEFELAQALFYAAWFSRDSSATADRMLAFLRATGLLSQYRRPLVTDYLRNHRARFKDDLFQRLPLPAAMPEDKRTHYARLDEALATTSLVALE